ncbi:MAG: NAD(P)/FAD-dependent oxidoreductase, partial [Betaproteobacteria bacterium]|nr:NAD(P)/FAD-dependent oxidoreductase [Betaproteobacteria bacterium]
MTEPSEGGREENTMAERIQSRRRLLQGAAAIGASAGLGVLSGCAAPSPNSTLVAPAIVERRLGRIGVIGGGFGGATAARYLKHWGGSSVDVVLIERNPQFVSCPLSNLVLGGTRRIEDLTLGYQGLRDAGVTVLVDEVTQIEPTKKVVSLVKIADQTFDRLIVAPGVDFQFDQIQGLGVEAQKTVLHAWKAGPQTVALRSRIEAMRQGGVFVLSIPRAPYRCPPGPYERV